MARDDALAGVIGDPVSELDGRSLRMLEEIFNDIQLAPRSTTTSCMAASTAESVRRPVRRHITTTIRRARSCSCSGPRTLKASTTRCRRRSGPARSATPARRAARSQFAGRPCDDHARGRDQARHAIGTRTCCKPFTRVLLKIISTGNQLAPEHDHPGCVPPTGAPMSARSTAPLKVLRKAIPVPTLHTLDTAWEVNLKTSVELYTIWEETGVLDQLKIDRREPVRRDQRRDGREARASMRSGSSRAS